MVPYVASLACAESIHFSKNYHNHQHYHLCLHQLFLNWPLASAFSALGNNKSKAGSYRLAGNYCAFAHCCCCCSLPGCTDKQTNTKGSHRMEDCEYLSALFVCSFSVVSSYSPLLFFPRQVFSLIGKSNCTEDTTTATTISTTTTKSSR